MKLTMAKVMSLEPVHSIERRCRFAGDRHPDFHIILKEGWGVPVASARHRERKAKRLKDCMAFALRAVKGEHG